MTLAMNLNVPAGVTKAPDFTASFGYSLRAAYVKTTTQQIVTALTPLVSAYNLPLPAGTVLHITSWYDNSSGNKFNPDPDNNITYGQRTIDEMGGAWISYYNLTDEEYKQQVEARKAKSAPVQSE